jgi:hypothetical protein
MQRDTTDKPRKPHTSRREFLAAGKRGGFDFHHRPAARVGRGWFLPSERINVAGIGCGGMGGGDIATITKLGANYVALCDVDHERGAGSFNAHPEAKRYKDFREMIDKEAKNIDAVTVGTPDHTHAVAALAAIRAGSTSMPEADDAHAPRMPRADESGQGGRRDDLDGQPGARQRRLALDERVDSGGRDRRGPRGPCLDRPRGQAVETRHPVSDGHALGAGFARLEPVARPNAGAALSPGLRPLRLARLVGLWHRSARRHGLPHRRSSGLGPKSSRRATSRPASRTTARISTATNRTSSRFRLRRSYITTSPPAAACHPCG